MQIGLEFRSSEFRRRRGEEGATYWALATGRWALVDTKANKKYVSRGGLKLAHALEAFGLDVRAMRCADFGCNVGGFTDCLLKHGAAHVTAIDTGYGALAWTLRNDPRVRVMERTNALYAPLPSEGDRVDLVVIDMGWTTQSKCVPAAMKWIRPGGRIVTLIKPHYEKSAAMRDGREFGRGTGVLEAHEAEAVVQRVLEEVPVLGGQVLGWTRSPLEGGEGKGNRTGNAEWLALLARANGPDTPEPACE